MNLLPPAWLVDRIVDWSKAVNPLTVIGVLVGVAIVLFAFSRLVRGGRAAVASVSTARRKAIAESLASRWQLFLLGTTGVVLSMASGYTTWMGMTNFTGEAVLSLMVTFGIQGVMLIVAWLIGESFATGMSWQPHDGPRANTGPLDRPIGIGLAFLVVGVAYYALLARFGAIGWERSGSFRPTDWTRLSDVTLYFAVGLVVLAVLALNFWRKGELSLPYVRSGRVIIKNAILWVMFLACMATSVFFSFDSLFGAIFPKDERVRAANLRAQNQVAGIVADIGDTIERRRNVEAVRLFDDKGWKQYEEHLTKLAVASQGAQGEIEAYFNDQLEQKNRAIKQQQERIASAQASSAGLQSKKISSTEELARLKGERPALAGELTEKKTELENRAKAVDAKRVEAQAEDKGVEGTGKQGRGPMYRQRMDELAKMQEAYKIQEDRVRDANKRLTGVDSRISQLERELASTDGDLAKLKGEAETAEQRIKLTNDVTADEGKPKIDPARVAAVFERARNDFRQSPTRDGLSLLQQHCSSLHNALFSTPATKGRVRDIDCDPKQAAEASAVMFALNDGMKSFETHCSGGDKLAANVSTDALYGFARKCLTDSGLPSRETEELRNKINFSDLARDDKAHPFVATLNAFHDGNYLAYLALAIAIAMDGLVFMSGLFGANAVRSPLSDVPSAKARSGKDLEKIVERSLQPHTFENAQAVLDAMQPMTPLDGYTARVVLDVNDPHAKAIRKVLNAAAVIGAARAVGGDHVYQVRSELFEFLSIVANRAYHADESHGRVAELQKVLSVALQPHMGDHADLVIHHCHPSSTRASYSAEINLDEMSADDAYVTKKVLNAAATVEIGNDIAVIRIPSEDYARKDRPAGAAANAYYVHKQLYKTLLLISAATAKTGNRSFAPQLAPPQAAGGVLRGGRLDAQLPRIEQQAQKALGSDVRGPAPIQHQQPEARDPFATDLDPTEPTLDDGREADEELRFAYWSRFLRAIDIDPDIGMPRLNVPELWEAAVNCWKALGDLAIDHPMLAKALRSHQQAQDRALAAEFEAISQEITGSRRKIDIVEEIYNHVEHYLPALMMFPENGLIAHLVREIEAAAAPDDGLRPGEQVLKDRLKSLQADIAGLDLDKAANWQQIGDWLRNDLIPDSPRVLRMQSGGQRQRQG